MSAGGDHEQPDALHAASLSTGARPVRRAPPRSTAVGAACRRRPHPRRPRPTALIPPAALLVALMIVWATLGHRFAGSTRFAGEGSAACLLGLAVGALCVVARKLFHPEVLQNMLSFDPANFFV